MRSFELSPGRIVDVLVAGAVHGPALVMHHGTPSDASLWSPWSDIASEHGMRLISVSRPGYATSTRVPKRTVADVAHDIEGVLDALDVPWFVTAGWSGGGPHALATGHLLGARCRAVATLAGVAPYGRDDLDFLAGMGPENHAEFGAALAGEAPLRVWLTENAAAMRTVTGSEIIAGFGGLISQVDKDVLHGGFADDMAAEMRRALEHGFDGWIDDDIAFLQPWGFDPEALTVPVTIWQGDRDLMVPEAHGAWLAKHIPSATAKPAPNHGHISLITTFQKEIVADLLEQASNIR